MDMTAALDVAVGLVLMYLVLSLLCTTINEFIASLFRLRANTLASALEQLIDHAPLKDAFDRHGLIDTSKVAASGGKKQPEVHLFLSKVLASATNNEQPKEPSALARWWYNMEPSYLSGRNVALALIGSLNTGQPIPGIGAIQSAVTALPASNIRSVLLTSLTEAGTDIEKLRDGIAAWFDGSMDRLSGAYKRYLQLISFLVGLVIAVLFNADTLHVGRELWHDRSLAQAIAQTAPDIMKKTCPNEKCDTAAAGDKPLPIDTVKKNFDAAEEDLRAFPIGWVKPNGWPADRQGEIWKVLGLLVTALALMMGAPFWFDALQKIMNIRGTGDKPAKSKPPQPTT